MRQGFLSVILLMGLIMSCQNVNQPDYLSSIAQQTDKKPIQQAKPSKLARSEFKHSVIHETPYFKIGPQQALPPDGSFKVGTKIRIIKEAGSYSWVESADGIKAFIATNDIEMIH